MTRPGKSASRPVPDPWVEYWYRVWEAAYTDHHPLVATYALARGSLRALRLDLSWWRR